ncbi:hypothetical protein [Massilia sp. TS11]|uniref:hypothetical protein n=1 Tax=Massilia sp. TS11 TaxID=2908003 RepID=UPI001EDB0ED0|nr:hypothetical protein [Massilia sp. TS11]MCG2583873.1 hypothetical protein [Massilia sp. TS11]
MLDRIRLNFELDRQDNPRLFDELMRFTKGPKRVNRLRTLAHDGLLAQASAPPVTMAQPQAPSVSELGSAAVEMFGPSI